MTQYDLGYKAYLDGETEDDNPNPYGSDDWNEWLRGFQQAEADD